MRPPQTAFGHDQVPTCGLRGRCPGHRQGVLTERARGLALGSNECTRQRESARSRNSAIRVEVVPDHCSGSPVRDPDRDRSAGSAMLRALSAERTASFRATPTVSFFFRAYERP